MNLHEKHIAAHYLVLHKDSPASTDLRGEHFTNAKLGAAWDHARKAGGWDAFTLLGDELTASLMDVITIPAEMPAHIDALKSEWVRRRAQRALATAADSIRAPLPFSNLRRILVELGASVQDVLAGGPHDSTTHAQLAPEVARGFIGDLQSEDRVITTPWKLLQDAIPGLLFGKVTLIGGRSSEHKTTLARLIMHYAVRDLGLTGTFWTGEDSAEDIVRRTVASEVPSFKVSMFATGRWSDDTKRPTEPAFVRAMREFEAHIANDYWRRFRIDDRGRMSIDDMAAFIRQQHSKHGIRIFVGDFIQCLRGINGKDDWDSAMQTLCGIAKELDIVMIWTSQIDKVGTKESMEAVRGIVRPPRAIDMLHGSTLFQRAYTVLMVGVDNGRLLISVDKHKSAPKDGDLVSLEIDAPHDRLGNYPPLKATQ